MNEDFFRGLGGVSEAAEVPEGEDAVALSDVDSAAGLGCRFLRGSGAIVSAKSSLSSRFKCWN